MGKRQTIRLVSFACLWLLAAATASAQKSVIRGTVVDIGGRPIAGATITAENPAVKRTVDTETDDEGRFGFIGLQRGQWLFTAHRRGYQPAQGFVAIRRVSDSGRVTLSMEVDLLDPPAPLTGHLAGIRAEELQASVDAAHEMFDGGDFDEAISAYEALLEQVPTLTSLNLQIGHAYREKREYQQALTAYRRVPADSPAAAEAESALRQLAALHPNR